MRINTIRTCIPILILLLITTKLSAQNAILLNGFVKDGQTNRAIEGVSVLIKGSNRGSSTNAEGIFEIRGLAKGSYTVVASFVGYGTK